MHIYAVTVEPVFQGGPASMTIEVIAPDPSVAQALVHAAVSDHFGRETDVRVTSVTKGEAVPRAKRARVLSGIG